MQECSSLADTDGIRVEVTSAYIGVGAVLRHALVYARLALLTTPWGLIRQAIHRLQLFWT